MLTLITIRSHFQNEFQNYILDKLDQYANYIQVFDNESEHFCTF